MRAAAATLATLISLTSLAGGESSEEEVDLEALMKEDGPVRSVDRPPTRVPEHDYDYRMLVFPLLLIAMLGWNVKWKRAPVPRKGAR